MKNGPIIILEDDTDDQEFISQAFSEIGIPNELKFFPEGKAALEYLYTTTDKPFLIISDINLPGMDGLELRRQIQQDEYLRGKAIPYIFLSTAAEPKAVALAYELTVQGFFLKPFDMTELKQTLQFVANYWKVCIHTNG